MDPKNPSKYFKRTQIKKIIDYFLGIHVDVVNGDNLLQSLWRIIKEAREDLYMSEDRGKYFAVSGIRSVPFSSPTFDLEKNLSFVLKV